MEIRRALISVSDKTGLKELVKGLNDLGIEMISTGGTAEAIGDFGVSVTEVSSYTGFPEMLDGRVKTLHPKIHAGLLARRDKPGHMKQLKENGILPIDMVVVNLYPFEQTISRDNVTEEEAIENIDIGGPAIMRSAAKNFEAVAVISSPSQYGDILEELKMNKGQLGKDTLEGLAAEVFSCVSRYDAGITGYLSDAGKSSDDEESSLPDNILIQAKKRFDLRYGENPHQHAAFYQDVPAKNTGIANAEQLQGKELSYNNIVDLSAALNVAGEFDAPAAVVIKHNNPCGAATGKNLKQAYLDALDCDRMSAFGGIIGLNGPVDGPLAETILDQTDFVECIIATGYDKNAIEVFKNKKNIRILTLPKAKKDICREKDFKKVRGGMLVQEADVHQISVENIKVVTKEKPKADLIESLIFGWKIVKNVKSNAIVLCKGTKTVGIGAGQMSRVDSVIIAARKASERAKGSILASDAFFPKADSIEQAHVAGISAIIQPGGSIKDQEMIDACDRFGIPMVFTGVRHFKH